MFPPKGLVTLDFPGFSMQSDPFYWHCNLLGPKALKVSEANSDTI